MEVPAGEFPEFMCGGVRVEGLGLGVGIQGYKVPVRATMALAIRAVLREGQCLRSSAAKV